MTSRTAGRAGAIPPDPRAADREGPPAFTTLKRAALAGATAFITVNFWTGAPLLALWVGSQAVGQQTLSMGAVGVVIVVLAALVFAMAIALTWLNNVYDELVGRPRTERRPPWLRSMRGESESSRQPAGRNHRAGADRHDQRVHRRDFAGGLVRVLCRVSAAQWLGQGVAVPWLSSRS